MATDDPAVSSDRDRLESRVSDAFKDLGNETRLDILLALWDAYEPLASDTAVPFSALRERVGTRDSGQFNYHLSKLTEQYVRQTEDGYELTATGLRLVRVVIAGTGFEKPEMPTSTIDVSCGRCGARPVEVVYRDEALFLLCTECDGFVGDGTFPVGTIGRFEFEPAGLAGRTPAEVFAASWIDENAQHRMCRAGVCPECAGRVEQSVNVCADHAPTETAVCPNCDHRDAVRVRYVCSVCKYWNEGGVQVTVMDQPAVVGFLAEHDVTVFPNATDLAACERSWGHLWSIHHEVVSTDPVRIEVVVPAGDDALTLTLDRDLTVLDVER